MSTLSAKHGFGTALGRSAEGLCASVERGREGSKTRFAAERPPSGEDAGIRALLSRVGACRAEGWRRFARVYSCRSALPTPTNTDLREARVLCGCIRAVGCYGGSDTLQGRSNGVIGCRRAANLYIFRLQGGHAQGGQGTREEAAALAVPGHDDVLRYATTNTCRWHSPALLVIAGRCTVYRARGRKQDQGTLPASARAEQGRAREVSRTQPRQQ